MDTALPTDGKYKEDGIVSIRKCNLAGALGKQRVIHCGEDMGQFVLYCTVEGRKAK